MKNLLLGFAVISLAIACKSGENNSVSDASTAEGPASACATACEGEKAASCGDAAASCDEAAAAGCDKAAAGCDSGEAQVCPVTGEKMEN
jgi:hypothetical protein